LEHRDEEEVQVVGKMLGSPKAWAPLLAVVILAFFYFLVNFGAARSPVENTRDLPVAIVNEDMGAEAGGEHIELGDEVLKEATTSEEIGDKVEWTRLESRQGALREIAEGRYYGALVIPKDYSRSVAELLSDPTRREAARIEILANRSAGPFASRTVEEILSGIVRSASRATSERITGTLEARGVRVSPQRAAVLGEPVVAKLTDAQPTGENSGRGLMPFYLVFTALILGFIGANAIYGGLTAMVEALAVRAGRIPSRVGLIFAATVLGLVLAPLLGAVEALVAFGYYGVHNEAGAFYTFLFLALVAAVSLFLALVLLAALGPRGGILTGSLLIISVGLATSGGTTPVQNLPTFFRALSGVLPFEYMTEGTRALLFYGGQLDAGLGDALQVLLTYLVGAVLLGGSISLARDRLARRAKLAQVAGSGLEREAATTPSASAETGEGRREG
jgi:YhgE/Pip-like protein